MATNFPSSLDTSTTLPAEGASTPLATNHVTAHQNIQDAIEAIEAKVGIDSSAVTSSHDYKLSEVTSTDKAVGKTATQTLTNKTLTSPTITSPTINLGSDAEGDTYYRNSSGALVRLPRGTDNHILKMNGNVPNWEAETVNANASTTVAGLVELATSAEVTAGTATGGSGAALVVTPDALAASTPVFNGSGITNIPKKVAIDIIPAGTNVGTSSTTTVFTTTVPANTYGADTTMRSTSSFKYQSSAGGPSFTINFKFGGVTFAQFTTSTSTASIDRYIRADITTVFNSTSGDCDVHAVFHDSLSTTGVVSPVASVARNLSTASLTSNQTMLIEIVTSTQSQGWYYSHTLEKI